MRYSLWGHKELDTIKQLTHSGRDKEVPFGTQNMLTPFVTNVFNIRSEEKMSSKNCK